MRVVVTGANRGIGLELCRQLHSAGNEVFATCRKPSAELTALECTVVPDFDVTSPAAPPALVDALARQSIDLLINNAGVLHSGGLDDLDFDHIEEQFRVNTLGPLRITAALVQAGCLSEGSKVALITSRMGSLTDNTSGGVYGYRMSKAALNAVGVSLAQDLKAQGIAVTLLHPGWVRTEMTNQNGLIDAAESASGLLKRIDALTLETTGGFWHSNGEKIPW